MSYLVHAIYHLLSLIPGLAARMHRPCGRMNNALRSGVGVAGILFVSGAAWCGFTVLEGFEDGRFGYFPAIGLGVVAAFLLTGGATACVRALKNPPPPALPDNVIAFRRPVKPAGTYQRRSVE
jgi:hypothetical protein